MLRKSEMQMVVLLLLSYQGERNQGNIYFYRRGNPGPSVPSHLCTSARISFWVINFVLKEPAGVNYQAIAIWLLELPPALGQLKGSDWKIAPRQLVRFCWDMSRKNSTLLNCCLSIKCEIVMQKYRNKTVNVDDDLKCPLNNVLFGQFFSSFDRANWDMS